MRGGGAGVEKEGQVRRELRGEVFLRGAAGLCSSRVVMRGALPPRDLGAPL